MIELENLEVEDAKAGAENTAGDTEAHRRYPFRRRKRRMVEDELP